MELLLFSTHRELLREAELGLGTGRHRAARGHAARGRCNAAAAPGSWGDASDLSEMQAKVRLIVFFARLASTRSRVNINSLEP